MFSNLIYDLMEQKQADTLQSDNAVRTPTPPQRFAAWVLLITTAIIGQASLLSLGLFLYHGSFHIIQLKMGAAEVLVFNTCLCLLFFAQHSIMVRKRFRQWLAKSVRTEFYSALYTIASGVMLLVLVAFWQKSAETIVASNGVVYWMFRGGYFLSIAGFVWGNTALGSFDSFGLTSIVSYVRGTRPKTLDFAVRGPYRWVRHPLYFCSLLMIWSCPVITADRLLFNLLFTIWMIIGMQMEERDLIASYGKAYLAYRQNVPMLLPRYICPGHHEY